MTQLSDFVEADPHVKEIREHHREQHATIHNKKSEVRLLARDISKLFLAYDLCVGHMHHFEDPTEELDKTLYECTTDNAEIWWHQYNGAADLVFDRIVETCKKISTKSWQIERAEGEAQDTCKTLAEARKQAAKRFHEQEGERE